MAEYSIQDKLILNRTAALCREYRFYESRRDIVQTAGLPPETAKLSISELRQIIDSRIANKVTPPVVGEMLRIESTFRHIRDIHNYNCRQAGAVIGQLDRTLPCLDNKNLWFAIRKMEQIYHLGGYEHFRSKLNEPPKAVDKVRLLNRMLKNKKNPLPAPNYAEEIKRQISTEGIRTINEELKKFNPELAARPMLVAGNKCDLTDDETVEEFARFVQDQGYEFFPIRAAIRYQVDPLLKRIQGMLSQLPPVKRYEAEEAPVLPVEDLSKRDVKITRLDSDVYSVEADWLLQILKTVNFDDTEGLQYFDRVLLQTGVIDALREAGVQEGDTVSLYNLEFDFVE